METKIYNIDSVLRNTTKHPNSHNFNFYETDTTEKVEPFREQNVISIKISSIEIPNSIYFINNSTRGNASFILDDDTYTINDGSYSREDLITEINRVVSEHYSNITFSLDSNSNKVTLTNNCGFTLTANLTNTTEYQSIGSILGFDDATFSLENGSSNTASNIMKNPQEEYIFLKINDIGNITHKNRTYASKIILNSNIYQTTRDHGHQFITKEINFNQPFDINKLEIGLYDYNNNLISLNGDNFSFTLEINKVNNSILKKYNEVSFYDDNAMQKILHAKMLEFFEKETNNSITNNFNNNMNTMHNQQEFNYSGNRNDYNY